MHGKTYQENKHVELAALADAVMAYADCLLYTSDAADE